MALWNLTVVIFFSFLVESHLWALHASRAMIALLRFCFDFMAILAANPMGRSNSSFLAIWISTSMTWERQESCGMFTYMIAWISLRYNMCFVNYRVVLILYLMSYRSINLDNFALIFHWLNDLCIIFTAEYESTGISVTVENPFYQMLNGLIYRNQRSWWLASNSYFLFQNKVGK